MPARIHRVHCCRGAFEQTNMKGWFASHLQVLAGVNTACDLSAPLMTTLLNDMHSFFLLQHAAALCEAHAHLSKGARARHVAGRVTAAS